MLSCTRALPALFLVGLVACGDLGDTGALVSRSIFTQAAQGPGSRVRLIELIPFAFDRVWVFPPDASAAAIRDSLGAGAGELDDGALAARGDSTFLIFARGDRVVFVVPHPPSRGEFHPDAHYRAFAPDDAVFVVDSASPPGRPLLRPAAPHPP